ncbi:MAG: hypothetical protein MRERC_6c068 [Mycoplasmataceae bacterium RC_NB112A]|nr:MAG: hypothetical protein MRERC_10c028 [Mycoplasmataceae bacterium RC_NB112A]KLL01962.1 MAG: hypothetical protein MRERC_6c053 [Mycoplasmataceae bacterium RC_NB112A]KLL01973.1 MAG: hypothetical protein MRERC_6c068 [Mycoplasmataceae bacterium RC_NB112A]
MVNAEIWLNANIPNSQRANIRGLLICSESQRNQLVLQDTMRGIHESTCNSYYLPYSRSLTGTLNLSSFVNLEKLIVENQFIQSINFTDCEKLKEIHCNNNLLRLVKFTQEAEDLEVIHLKNNNFWATDLSCFSRFTNLITLNLGTDDIERIRKNVYNRWNGSLVHLWDLEKLMILDINSTDISRGLEYLPTEGLVDFFFGNKGREGAGVDELKRIFQNLAVLEEGETLEDWATKEEWDEDENKLETIREWQSSQEFRNQIQQVQQQISLNRR